MVDSEILQDAPGTPATPESPDGILASDAAVDNGTGPPLKKGTRQRLLRGLQRMSSSPSLARMGRARSASSPYRLGGALSCVSLASTSSPFGVPPNNSSSYFTQPPGATGSSAHTSIPTSPIAESPHGEGADLDLAVRALGSAPLASTTVSLPAKIKKKAKPFYLWTPLPHELKVHILSFLRPKELVRVSRVSKEFHDLCFDGQLWTRLDASEFYREIPAASLAKMVVAAGPFVKDLNLRGCLQIEEHKRAEIIVNACQNLVNATLEGCRNLKRTTLHTLLRTNHRLTHLNLTGLPAVHNATCKVIATSCPQLEVLNVSWCPNVDARGLKFVIEACPQLRDLRAGEIKKFHDHDVAAALFHTNTLERLVLAGCDDLTDFALQIMLHGSLDPELDYLTDRPLVPPRKWRHLNLSRCARLSDAGVRALAHHVPLLEGLQLTGVKRLTDAALEPLLASTPRLTHLDLEEIPELTNALLSGHLARAPCARGLEHLTLSYCEKVGDAGVLPVVRACTRLRSLYLDNTRVSDLVLAEAAAMVRERSRRRVGVAEGVMATGRPVVGLTVVVYDCALVTWTGVREVLSRNAERPRRGKSKKSAGGGGGSGEVEGRGKDAVVVTTSTVEVDEDDNEGITSLTSPSTSPATTPFPLLTTPQLPSTPPTPTTRTPPPPKSTPTPTPPKADNLPPEIIALRCFYGWQLTVDEHTKRVLRGDLPAADRLERKWADYMQASEEAGVAGAGSRRRRRRAREAQAAHGVEQAGITGNGGAGAGGGGNGTAGGNGGGNGNGAATATAGAGAGGNGSSSDDEDDDDVGVGGLGGGRRRARTTGCVVM